MTTKDEALKLALKRAFNLGQTYWQQVDSEYPIHWKKGDVTLASFNQLVEDTIREALAEQPAQQQQCMEHGECFGGECIYAAQQPAQQQEPSMAYKVKMCPRQECASAAKCMSVACSSRAYIKPEQPAQQHIEHCLWARNGHTPCPHVQPAQQQEPLNRLDVACDIKTLCANGDLPDSFEEVADWIAGGSIPAQQQELKYDEHGHECSPEEFLLRGILASELKCWHRLTADEAQNLVAFVQNMQSKPAQQQEPVAIADGTFNHNCPVGTPLYTSPPASKPWVGLSTDEIYDMYNEPRSDAEMVEFARAIEAKLREKNA